MKKNTQKTVLVISDGHEQFDLTASLLRNEGYRVRFGSDTNESLMIAEAEPLDLIISELAVPNVDGLQLCRLVRENQGAGSTPILLVGDLSKQSPIVEDSFRCGAAEYVQKPIDAFKLVDLCRDMLAPTGTSANRGGDLLSSLIENISDFITIVDPDDLRILFESPSTQNILGYNPSELVGRSFLDLVHPSDVSEITEYLNLVQWDAADAPPAEYRFRQKDGSWKLLESRGTSINDPGFGSAFVITSREKTENGLSLDSVLENDILRTAIFDRIPLGIALFSSSGHLIESNPALLQMLDYSESELCDMSLSEFIFPYDVENDKRALVEIFSGKRDHYQFENGYLTPTGERIWGRLTLVMMPGKESQYLIGIFEDPAAEQVADAAPLKTERTMSHQTARSNILDFERWRINKGLICEN